MLWSFFLQIIAGILGIFLADRFIQGVEFTGPFFPLPKSQEEINIIFGTLVFVGFFLGFLNFFVKPILKFITLPLRIITFNLFSLVIAIILVLIIDIIFPELKISGIVPLFWTTIIVWGLGFILSKWLPQKRTNELKAR